MCSNRVIMHLCQVDKIEQYVIFNVNADIFDGSPSNYHLLVFDLGKVSYGIHGNYIHQYNTM